MNLYDESRCQTIQAYTRVNMNRLNSKQKDAIDKSLMFNEMALKNKGFTGKQAIKALWTYDRPIVPLCEDCAARWNFYGYAILTGIRVKSLILNIIKFTNGNHAI